MTQQNDNDNGNHKITAKILHNHRLFLFHCHLCNLNTRFCCQKYDKYQPQEANIRGRKRKQAHNPNPAIYHYRDSRYFAYNCLRIHTHRTYHIYMLYTYVCVCVCVYGPLKQIFLVWLKNILAKTPSFPLVITIIYVLTAWRNTLIR